MSITLGLGLGLPKANAATVGAAGGGVVIDPTLFHYIIIGQSRANGADSILPAGYGGGALSQAAYVPPAGVLALMLNTSVRAAGDTANGVTSANGTATALGTGLYTSLVNLFETTDATPHSETPAWGLSYYLAKKNISTIVSASAGDNKRYNEMNSGSTWYQNTLNIVTQGKALATALGRPYRVGAILVMHGEADQLFGIAGYNTSVATWQANYEASIQAITGQSQAIPFYIDQQHSQSPDAAGTFAAGTDTAYMGYLAWKANPTKIILVGSSYHLSPRMLDGSSLHMSPWAERTRGEEFGYVIYRNQFLGLQFRPPTFVPGTLNFNGVPATAPTNTVQWDMYSPDGGALQLAYDYVGRSDPDLGFTYFDPTSPPTVTAVTQIGPTRFQAVLSGVPTAVSGWAMRSAFGSGTGTDSGPFRLKNRNNACTLDLDTDFGGDPIRFWSPIAHEAIT